MREAYRIAVTQAWLAGQLAQVDVSSGNYPKLEELTGDAPPKAKDVPEGDASSNARAWGAWLRTAERQKQSSEE